MAHIATAHRALLLGFALILGAATPAAAAQEGSAGPEGVEWHLTGYADGDDLAPVPWDVEATLRMEDGEAGGSLGCNGFGADYEIDGSQLTIGLVGHTYMSCAAITVETGYRRALERVASWSISGGEGLGWQELRLHDEMGDAVLAFELPVVALTRHDVRDLAGELSALQNAVERLDERLDNVRIGTLRDRIRSLEAQAAASAGPDRSAFSAAERVLLEAVRADIARTCEPRRSQNPAGTVAALQCRPESEQVRDMAYYLMEGDDAWKVFRERMRDAGVKNGTERRSCAMGRPSQMAWTGAGMVAAGCYRNEDGRANLRFTNTAAECRQLAAGGTQLESPHVYIAVLGPDRDIAGLWEWAASSRDWEPGDDLFDPIRQPGQPRSGMCPGP